MRYYVAALLVILIDQITKWLVLTKMSLGQSIPVIDGFFFLTSHRNRGAAWGILEGQMWFFYIVTIAVIIGVVVYIEKVKKTERLLSWALALILGGAIGNFIDRLFRKEVVDFIDIYFFHKEKLPIYNYPIFNVADSALVVGVIIIFIYSLLESKKEKRNA
ncbi:signal peptidase II [Bacillus solimangrovi]|uniref:Lipoprotein signal peptidase n=1 Tax=Bacillus solimangrovi TaxID=1305675 RepID=A0A1E5LAR8_9BACI|nr:signal peptidase II [Bacillus solimangrovi]OEH91188.1 signal peptidase II [Bacillus solimangrovi]